MVLSSKKTTVRTEGEVPGRKKIRVRIAPSPTGYPHIGTIYQALFDYAYARGRSGTFVIRIEDTDQARFVMDAEDEIYNAIDWFGLTEDESPRKGGPSGPYRQSERLAIYQKYARELIEKGSAYYCFCSKERLEEVRQRLASEKKQVMYDKHCRNLTDEQIAANVASNMPRTVRLRVPENRQISFTDWLRGEISFNSNLVDDQVLLKSDGFPTYHLAVVVDDHLMEISHVVRGEEWLSSTPKHILLYQAFGWEIPSLIHTPILRNPDKSKLSKRQGHTNVSWYREAGYLPEAILNYLALMGWSHPEGKEIFPLSEFIEQFDFKDVNPIGPIFDLAKLNWMNQHYIQETRDEELLERLLVHFPDLHDKDQSFLLRLMPLVKTRMDTLSDFTALTRHFFVEPDYSVEDGGDKKILAETQKSLTAVKKWQADAIFLGLKSVMQEHKVRMPFFYKLFTGAERGLPLPQSLEIIGRDRTLARLDRARAA